MRATMMTAMVFCALAMPAVAQDVSGAREASQRFTAAMSGGDAASAAAIFTDDAVVLPPGRDVLSGKPAIQSFLGGMAHGVQNLKYTPEDMRPVDDNVARETGSFSFKSKGQNARDVTGKYLIVWVKNGGDWKIAADMWNRTGGNQGGGNGQGRRGSQNRGTAEPTGQE